MMLTIARLQSFYDQLKSGLEDSTIVIGGGAVYDTLNGRPVRDLDVYVQSPFDWDTGTEDLKEDISNTVTWFNRTYYTSGKCLSKSDIDKKNYGTVSVQTVWHWDHTIGDLPVDMIFVSKPPSEYIETEFSFGLCQAWVGHYGLRTTRAYWRDSLNRTITFMLDHKVGTPAHDKCREHALKLKLKYPDWKFRNITPTNPHSL